MEETDLSFSYSVVLPFRSIGKIHAWIKVIVCRHSDLDLSHGLRYEIVFRYVAWENVP